MEVYFFVVMFVIPCMWWGAANGSHDYATILASAVVWAFWLLFDGVPFHALLVGVAAWLALSVMWTTHYGNSINDLLMLLAIMTIVLAVQQVDGVTVLLMGFMPACGMAGLEIYQWVRKQEPNRRGALFGNTNHSGIYYAIYFFVGLWLSRHISVVFLPFSLLLLLGIVYSRCRAALLGLCIGAGVAVYIDTHDWLILSFCVFLGILGIITQRVESNSRLSAAKRALIGRWIIVKKTVKMIVERPVFGWGLGTFRKEHQERTPAITTHRVHNDILEITFETGVVGLCLIAGFFWSLSWSDPFFSAALVAGIVSSCFFFTFRESHTAAPLMVLCGLSLPPVEVVAIPYAVSVVVVLAMARILWVHVIKKWIALVWWAKGAKHKTLEAQLACIEKAVKWYPLTEYIARYSYTLSFKNPGESYEAASRMIYQYDGRVVLWEAYDQMARAAFRAGALNIAYFFNKKSLELKPEFERGLKFQEGIQKIFKDAKEGRHGTVAVH